MASDIPITQRRYTVYMPNGPGAVSHTFFLEEGAYVQDLTVLVRDNEDWHDKLLDEEVFLIKCDNLTIEPDDTRLERVWVWLREHAKSRVIMVPASSLKYYFQDGPPPGDDNKIHVIVATESTLDELEETYTLPEEYAFKVYEERLQRATEFGNLPSPSDGAHDEIGIKECTDEGGRIHAHRPAGNYGPPTALFNHALARLKHRLEHMDQLEELEPSSDLLASCHRLILDVCEVDDDEDRGNDNEDLREKCEEIIEEYVGELGLWKDADATCSDPVWLICKFKNEVGLGGNATYQAVIEFGKILSQPKYKKFVERSNCPVVLIGMMGNRLEISTAVFTDGIYVDRLLSQEIYSSPWRAETVLRLGRIFKALSLSTAELHEYYNMLKCDVETNPYLHPQPPIAYLYPDPLPVEVGQHIPTLSYLGKISHTGRIFDFFQEDQEEVRRERPYALYLAKKDPGDPAREVEVVVKFTAHYNKRAHEILAAKRLAPKLYYCAPVVGGLHMVVMEYVKTKPLWCPPIPWNYGLIYREVKMAVELLHDENLVFGDLRVQNIMPKRNGGAVLIDFDWVGEHQKDRYPASWNDSEPDEWADGVGRWMFMDKAHDLFMLRKVKYYLENTWRAW